MAERYLNVELRDVRLVRDRRTLLQAVDWDIRPGQRWLLVGHNGAGKTLLMKLLAGDVWPTAGRRRYGRLGRWLAEPYEIKEQIAYLGAERQDRYERYRWNPDVYGVVGTGLYHTDIPLDPLDGRDRARISALLARLELTHLGRRRFLTLSYGERRLVLLARALAAAPRLLLLDELLTGLDGEHRQRALRCLSALARTRLPWVLSTHRPQELEGLATHVCELRAGRIIRCGALQRRPSRPRLRAIERSVATVGPASARPVSSGQPLIRLQGATVWRAGSAVLRRITLTVRRGDCWLVHGPNGSGKSSLIATLYGDLGVAVGGTVWREGIEPGTPLEGFKRRIGWVSPELQAMHPLELQAAQVVASGLNASIAVTSERPRPSVAQRIRGELSQVGAATLAARPLRSLSYGQLRRVLFARALIGEPDILLLDEPYAGLDAATRARLHARLEAAAQAGVTVVMASHHRDEWPACMTHELELEEGAVVYCGPRRGAQPGSAA